MAGSIAFSGMASGLDTDSMVEAMTATYKNRVDKSEKQEKLLEWKEEIYKEVSSKVYKFYTTTASNLRLNKTFDKKTITSSDTTHIKLNPSSVAPTGTHKLENLQMATSATLQTHQIPARDKLQADGMNTTLESLGITENGAFKVYDREANKTVTIQIVDSIPKEESTSEDTIYLTKSDKLSTLQDAMKSAMPSATVNFDTNAGAFFISSQATGEKQGYSLEGDSKILQAIGLADAKQAYPEGSNPGTIKLEASGSSASYTYNGIPLTSESNEISINGLKFTITANQTESPIMITSTTDVEGMVDTVKSFVDEYNKMIEELGDLVDADSAGGYEPLLDEEKEGMTESQIDKWEQKIKDSLLSNDSTLKSLMASMRNVLGSTVKGNKDYDTLASIGITTSSDWTQNGKLELDEEKLKEALAKNPEEVKNLFTSSGTKDAEGKEEMGTQGIGKRLYDSLKTNFTRVANVKSTTSLFHDVLLTEERKDQADTTNSWEDRLERMKKLYYTKFTAMETALSKLNAQTDSLTSLLNP